jgi:hypothetical protein
MMNYTYPHPLARHWTCAPFACNSPLVLRIEQSHRREWESLVVERCAGCGRVVAVQGVLHEPDRREW